MALWLLGCMVEHVLILAVNVALALGCQSIKISALIAIDLFIHYNTAQWKPTLLHCHSPCSSRALAKSISYSKTQDFRWGQTSVKLPVTAAPCWDTEGPPSITSHCSGQGIDVHFHLFHHLLLNGKRKPLSFLSTSIQQWRKKASPKWKCKLSYPIGYKARLQPAAILGSTVIGFA